MSKAALNGCKLVVSMYRSPPEIHSASLYSGESHVIGPFYRPRPQWRHKYEICNKYTKAARRPVSNRDNNILFNSLMYVINYMINEFCVG